MSFLLVFLNVSGTDCMQYTLRQQHLLHTREMFTTQNNNKKKKNKIKKNTPYLNLRKTSTFTFILILINGVIKILFNI